MALVPVLVLVLAGTLLKSELSCGCISFSIKCVTGCVIEIRVKPSTEDVREGD